MKPVRAYQKLLWRPKYQPQETEVAMAVTECGCLETTVHQSLKQRNARTQSSLTEQKKE